MVMNNQDKIKVNIKFKDLLKAFFYTSDDVTRYLNIETGEIAMHSNFSGAFDSKGNPIKETDFFNSKKHVEIPGIFSFELFRDMERFTENLDDKKMTEKLHRAIEKSTPFRSFRKVLNDYPEIREKWLHFEAEANRNRVLEWLAANNLELSND